jgi:uncharacterized protein
MIRLREFAHQHPLLSYLLLCFGITWPIWFCVPLVAGTDWSLGKIVTGIGFGPALAIIVLDRLRGTGAVIASRRWIAAFLSVAFIVSCLDVSSLLTGDAISATAMASAQATGLTISGMVSALVAGTVSGFIFASVTCSRDSRLASLLAWKLPVQWWLLALFLPASWMLLGVGVTWIKGEPIDSVSAGLPALSWALFVLRSIVFTALVVAVGEEAGWRGWMLPELQKRFSPLLSSILLGIVWGLWHFPLFINGQYDQEPVLVFAKAGACAFLAILFTWLYNRSGGSLLLAVVLHTALNNTPRLIPATDAMAIGMLAAVVGAVILDRMWRRIRRLERRSGAATEAVSVSSSR